MLADCEPPSLEEVRRRILDLVKVGRADERGGVVMTDISAAYRSEYGENVPFRQLGYVKLSVFLSDMDDLVIDYGGSTSAAPVVRLKGESFSPSKGQGIHVNIPRGVHEKSRLEIMRSMERINPDDMHQLVLSSGDEFETCLPENFERVHAGESSTQRAFASHRRKRLEREKQVALDREAQANSIVRRVPSPRHMLTEDSDECEPEAQLSLRDEVELLMPTPPEPSEISTEALTWGFLQPVKLATGVKAAGAWGVLQRQHSTKDVRAATSAVLQPGTLLGKGTNTCTLASWDGEEHCAVAAAELDPTGTSALMYWQVVIQGKPGSAVLGVLRAPYPDKQKHDAEMARERRRLKYGIVSPTEALKLSYRTEAEHCANLPNTWPRVWSSHWSVSYLHGPEWSGRYHLQFTDEHRFKAIELQKAFRKYAPIIKAAKVAKEAIDAARPGCRYDPNFYGWGSNGAVYVGGKPPADADEGRKGDAQVRPERQNCTPSPDLRNLERSTSTRSIRSTSTSSEASNGQPDPALTAESYEGFSLQIWEWRNATFYGADSNSAERMGGPPSAAAGDAGKADARVGSPSTPGINVSDSVKNRRDALQLAMEDIRRSPAAKFFNDKQLRKAAELQVKTTRPYRKGSQPQRRNVRGPWNVSRIAENETIIFKLERGKLSFQVPRTGASGSIPLPWEDLDGAEDVEERRKVLTTQIIAAKRGEHDAELSKLADWEIFKTDSKGNLTNELRHDEEIRRRKAREEIQDLEDELRDMEMRGLLRRAADVGAPNITMPDEFRVCCDLTSECSVSLEHIPPFDAREF